MTADRLDITLDAVNQELARLHLTGDVDADLTPEQKRDRLNYMLQKAGYVRPNTETKQE